MSQRGGRMVFYLFKWRLPAFAAPRERGRGSQHSVIGAVKWERILGTTWRSTVCTVCNALLYLLIVGLGRLVWGGACGHRVYRLPGFLSSSELAPASECCPLLVPRGEHLQSLVEEGAGGANSFGRRDRHFRYSLYSIIPLRCGVMLVGAGGGRTLQINLIFAPIIQEILAKHLYSGFLTHLGTSFFIFDHNSSLISNFFKHSRW